MTVVGVLVMVVAVAVVMQTVMVVRGSGWRLGMLENVDRRRKREDGRIGRCRPELCRWRRFCQGSVDCKEVDLRGWKRLE